MNPANLTDRPVIVIADDDPAARSFLQQALEREGFGTLLAADGQEAIALLHRHREVAVLLLDVQMPNLDGLQTLREVRSDDLTRTLPVILVTGSQGESDRVRGLDAGADDYLVKPVSVKELVARVRAQIRGRAAWARELERGRAYRRRLAAALDELPRDIPLIMLATTLVERLPAVLDVEAIAVLHFARDSVRSVAASGPLRPTFPPSKALAKKRGTEIASRSEAGAWLENASAHGDSDGLSVDIAFVPFRLGMSSKALGCLVFAGRPGDSSAPMSHRLPDLIDATSFIVGVLRPAIERAQTAGDAITTVQGVIARHEFTIHLQPIARLDTGVVVAAEALTRFASGISPDVQFAEAARLGLGLALERATLTAAIVAALGLPRDVALSVNVSPDVLQHEPRLGRILATAKRPVIVELTEHERIDDYGAVRSALGRLGSNVRLAVDDAGSGYASLRHILALKPTYVKLDIEWVRGIDHDPVRRALVTGLSTFASETGCELIAEGIETEDERQALLGLGVCLGQGYLLGRPEPMAGGSGRLNTLIAQSGP